MSFYNRTFGMAGNAKARIKRFFRGHSDGSFTLRTEQDVTDIVEANKAIYNMHDGIHFNDHDYGATVARIPIQVFFELERLGITLDEDAFGRWLDDADNRVFRVAPGRVRGTAKYIGA